jgi:hypothetical protein
MGSEVWPPITFFRVLTMFRVQFLAAPLLKGRVGVINH